MLLCCSLYCLLSSTGVRVLSVVSHNVELCFPYWIEWPVVVRTVILLYTPTVTPEYGSLERNILYCETQRVFRVLGVSTLDALF